MVDATTGRSAQLELRLYERKLLKLRLGADLALWLIFPDTPSQRVQFILGTEDDEEHVPHELFTELDEICMKEGEDAEWKETAR